MTVGVIITVYNLEQFSAEAINSVLNQSLKPERIVVINDGSTDGSQQILQQFGTKIEIINHVENQGVLPSVIEGIRLLNTDVISLLDGDDVWEGTKLQEIRACFHTDENVMMVLHNFLRINAAGDLLSGMDKTQINLSRIERQPHSVQDELLKESILSYRGVWLGSALSFRKSFLNIDLFEKWSLGIWGHELSHQDQPLAAFLIATNKKKYIQHLPKALFRYRIFGENSSGSSATLAKALKTLKRSRATLLRTHTLVREMEHRKPSLKRQEYLLKEIDYLEALYRRNTIRAFVFFVVLFFQFWTKQERIKESVRFLGVFILGPSRFLKVK